MSRLITIDITPGGETTIRAEGFTGSDCKQATRSLEKALGLKTSERLTSEFYQTPTNRLQQRSETE